MLLIHFTLLMTLKSNLLFTTESTIISLYALLTGNLLPIICIPFYPSAKFSDFCNTSLTNLQKNSNIKNSGPPYKGRRNFEGEGDQQPQPQSPQPLPLLPQPLPLPHPLPQQQNTIMRSMIIQQQLFEPKPLHMCLFPPFRSSMTYYDERRKV